MRGAERIQPGVAGIAAVELEAHAGTALALAGRSASEVVLQSGAELLQVLRRHHAGGAEAQFLSVRRIQHEVEGRQDVHVAAAVLERHIVGIHAVPGRGAHISRSIRIRLGAIDRQLGPDDAYAVVRMEQAGRIARVAHDVSRGGLFLDLVGIEGVLEERLGIIRYSGALPHRVQVRGGVGHAARDRILHGDRAIGEIIVGQKQIGVGLRRGVRNLGVAGILVVQPGAGGWRSCSSCRPECRRHAADAVGIDAILKIPAVHIVHFAVLITGSRRSDRPHRWLCSAG